MDATLGNPYPGEGWVRWVVAPNPSVMTLDGTRTFVVGREKPAVIDPGPALEAHLDQVLSLLDGATPVAILLTHAHSDHAEAAADLARLTGAPVWLGAGCMQPVDRLPPIDHVARDGDEVDTDAGSLVVILTPGHSPEHVSFHWPRSAISPVAAVFVGDLFMGEGDTTLVAHPEGDVGAYLASLDRIDRLAADLLFPAHGDPLTDAASAVGRFRRHRLERIRQVSEALREQPRYDQDALVQRIYGASFDARLREAARGSIAAVVHFLQSQN